jgi:hypothetical protein
MSATPKHNITADKALDLITSGQPLSDVFISGKLDLTIFYKDNFEKDFIAVNCIFEHLQGSCVQFARTVSFSNCEFIKCDFTFTYFLGGLIIDNSVFESYLDMQAGGHNKDGKAVSITNSTFKNFVNFFDCWYESEVIIKDNNFQKGTNIFGKPNGIPVTFNVSPLIESNKGQLDVDGEADLKTNVIDLRHKNF